MGEDFVAPHEITERMTLYKPQNLWDIAFFILSEEENLLDCVKRNPDRRFTPQSLIRTHYHQVTGYADPFLFVHKEWLYLFYEEERLKAKAPLCAKRTRDLKHWESLGVVLKEDHHLSYPNVFEHEGEIYMLPETRECEAVILYKALEFPYHWEKYKILVEGDKYADSCLLFYEGKWYLFTTAWYGKKNGLRIFVSDALAGDYVEHPMSPITDDIAMSRCGGAVFSCNGKLFRPAQYCTNYYGENLGVFEIVELSPLKYEERLVKQMIDKLQDWNRFGGHHLNTTVFNGKRIVVMDGVVNDNWLNNHTRKLFNYIHHLSE
jgi:hypothetical protein